LGFKEVKTVYASDHSGDLKTVALDAAEQKKFSLSDDEILEIARTALIIEDHYSGLKKSWSPMDIEWAKDGNDGKLYILQARPETVKSRSNTQVIERYQLSKRGKVKVEGRSIGQRIGSGKAKVIKSLDEMDRIQKGDVLIEKK
jgi:pyruvate,water dikinase